MDEFLAIQEQKKCHENTKNWKFLKMDYRWDTNKNGKEKNRITIATWGKVRNDGRAGVKRKSFLSSCEE